MAGGRLRGRRRPPGPDRPGPGRGDGDFDRRLRRQGRTRHPDIPCVAGDALRLPFADAGFDVTTISYGLRNVSDPLLALREMLRVTRPGGRLVVAEFSRPAWPPFRALYDGYLERVLPAVARAFASDAAAYGYLSESILAWPGQEDLARLIQEAGWRGVAYRNLTGGIVAIHRAVRPPA